MRSDDDPHQYRNCDPNECIGRFRHHHNPLTVSDSTTFEASNNNGGLASHFDQTSNHQTASNNLNLRLHPQGGSPIGLTLRKSTSLINLVEMALSQERQHKTPGRFSSRPHPLSDKLKASNLPALLLQIGSWKRISRNEGDVVVKLYYAKKKLVWELLDGPLKSKIEIQWSEISAIRAVTFEGEPGRLQIELNQPPQYGREIDPQPRKHTQWKQTTDFTGGQASICRRHLVIFPPGVLDKQYEKLLQCDNQLFALSRRPFPIDNYPFFFHDIDTYLDYSYQNVDHRRDTHFLGDHASNSDSLVSVTRFQHLDERAIRYANENHKRRRNQLEGIPAIAIGEASYYAQESWIPIQQSETSPLFESTSGFDSGIGFPESSSRVAAPDLYGLPWGPGMELASWN